MSTSTRMIARRLVPLAMAVSAMLAAAAPASAALGNVSAVQPPGHATASEPSFRTFRLPERAVPTGLVADLSGRIWFTEANSSVDAVLGTINERGKVSQLRETGLLYPDPTQPPEGSALAAASDGSVRFTEPNPNPALGLRVVTRSKTGAISYLNLPDNGGGVSMTVTRDGDDWFTDFDYFDRVTPAGALTIFPIARGLAVDETALGQDGSVWFTGNLSGRSIVMARGHAEGALDPRRGYAAVMRSSVGRISANGTFALFPLPAAQRRPFGITPGSDGNLWFTVASGIGRITHAGRMTFYKAPGGPAFITRGRNGDLWFTAPGTDSIGRITTEGHVTEFPIPRAYGSPAEIALARSGAAWFTIEGESGPDAIGRMAVPK